MAEMHKLANASEAALSALMAERYEMSFIPIAFGRVELEEYLSLRWQNTLLNAPPRRLHRTDTYSWVTPE